jgi:uncharacterized protein
MPMTDPVGDLAHHILEMSRTIPVVGASPNPHRPSHRVMHTLLEHGYHVIPVTPKARDVLGLTTYPTLRDIPGTIHVDVVDLFRRSELVAPHVEEAIAIGADAIWMQLGVRDHQAADRARQAGLQVVMDRCPAIALHRSRLDRWPGRSAG